ncbi:TRAP transporter small permease [Salinisphaera aquimarina]|uniref:TRAP transporter small permease protein n=1 Tax=Salinisphaera aquimarina TaxID=2094031 RepID=A0ABV7EVE8_9GAMM
MTQKENAHTHDAPARGNAVLSVLNAIDIGLGWLERVIVGGSVLVMALLMSCHVVGNLLFDRGIPGTYEVTEMLIVVMTFVGVGYAARNARHISMSAIYDQLSGRLRKALLIVICLGTAALMFYFAFKSAEYVVELQGRGRVSSSLHVPIWIINLALPIGFTLAGVQYLLTTIRNLMSDDIYRSFTEKEEYSDVPLDESGTTHAPDEPYGV